MGLDSIIRSGVATIDAVTASLQVSVTHAAWTGHGNYAEPTYATGVARKAIVVFKQRMRKLGNGQEVLQQASVVFPRPIAANGTADRREPIDPRDKLTLPNGYTGPILDVQGVVDPLTNAPYSLEVILG